MRFRVQHWSVGAECSSAFTEDLGMLSTICVMNGPTTKKSLTSRVEYPRRDRPATTRRPSRLELGAPTRTRTRTRQWTYPTPLGISAANSCYRFLKWPRVALAIEDAGTEIHDEGETVSPRRGRAVPVVG